MKYINSTLNKNETVLGHATISNWSMAHGYALAILTSAFALLTPVAIVLPLIILGTLYLIRKTTEMAVTNRRVIIKTGLISRSTTELRLAKVESVSLDQGIEGRILNYGNVVVTGSGSSKIVMKNARDPLAFRAAIEEACDL